MKKLILFIKSLFSSLESYVRVFIKKNDEAIKKYAPVAVDVVNFLKEYTGSTVAADLFKFLEGIGNPVVSKGASIVYKILSPAILDKIGKVLGCLQGVASDATMDDKIKQIALFVEKLTAEDRKDALTSIASIIAEALSDGKLSWKELYIIIEAIYVKNKNRSAKLMTSK